MITLWGRRSSSNVQKALWTLLELGVPFERKCVGGSFSGTRTPEFLGMSPNALIPALEDGDIAMSESNAIVRYLAARYGANGFQPKSWRERAQAEFWMEWQQLNVWPLVSAIFMMSVREPLDQRKPETVAFARQSLPKHLAVADRRLAESRYFAGDTLTFGDIVMGTIMRRNQLIGVSLDATPNVARWFSDLQSREPYRHAIMVPDFGTTPESWTAHEKDLG